MGQITYLPNLLEPAPEPLGEYTGPLIEWLSAQYPAGFPQQQYVYVNREFLPIEDYDRVIAATDQVLIILRPQGPVAVGIAAAATWLTGTTITAAAVTGALVASAVAAVASVAINYAFQKLFPTKIASNALASAESTAARAAVGNGVSTGGGSVYSLSVPTNIVKLGDPVPVIYGTVLTTPDIAAQPYSFYRDNEQYVDMLYCLGQGVININKIYVSDTPIDTIRDAAWRAFKPSEHKSAIGNIQAAWAASTGRGFQENVDTSIEVAEQELKPADPLSYSGTVVGTTPVTAAAIDSRVTAAQIVLTGWAFNPNLQCTAIAADRRTLTVTPAWVNSKIYTSTTVLYTHTALSSRVEFTGFDAPTAAVFAKARGFNTLSVRLMAGGPVYAITGTMSFAVGTLTVINAVGADQLTDGGPFTLANFTITALERTSFSFSAAAANQVGPFFTNRPGSQVYQVQTDFVFPNGLYSVDPTTGNYQTQSVQLLVTVERVNDAGAVLGTEITRAVAFSQASSTPLRRTEYFDVAPGRFRVSVVTTWAQSTGPNTVNRVLWTGLRGAAPNVGVPAYGDVTLLSIRFKANVGLNSGAINRVGVDCTRVLPDGTTRNDCAAAAYDIYTNARYGARRPVSEIDAAAFATLKPLGTFNGIFDSKTTIWEALRSAMLPARSAPVTDGALLSAMFDVVQASNRFVFTESNMVADSVTYSWVFSQVNDTDGYEIEWREPSTWIAQYTLYPATAVNAERVTLMGCTSLATAQGFAKYLWNRKQYRRKIITFQTELEGHLPQIGDRISVGNSRIGPAEPYIVTKITPDDGYTVQIEGYNYDARVYA